MKITLEKLDRLGACQSGIDWFKSQAETDARKVIKSLLADNHFNWANWLIVRLMSKGDKVRYAIYAAESVIEIFEKKYPYDKRPREAIEAAKKWVKNPSKKNKAAAAAAAAYAYAAAAYAAAYAAAAYAAAAAAAAHAAAVYAAADAAAAAYAAADADAAAAARKELQIKIISYGLRFIK